MIRLQICQHRPAEPPRSLVLEPSPAALNHIINMRDHLNKPTPDDDTALHPRQRQMNFLDEGRQHGVVGGLDQVRDRVREGHDEGAHSDEVLGVLAVEGCDLDAQPAGGLHFRVQ